MRDLDKGHQLLQNRMFQEAYAYFTMMATLYGHVPQTLNGCTYGQARALANMKRPDEARALLLSLIEKVPNWEAPYITLARLYETEGQTLKHLGQPEAALQYMNEAEKIYLLAINQTNRSERLTKHFEYFLNELYAPWQKQEKQNTFTPGFSHHNQRKLAQTTSTIARDINAHPQNRRSAP